LSLLRRQNGLCYHQIFYGEKSGAATVRTIIQIYNQISDLAEKFLDEEGLVIAEVCDIVDGFTCTGGVIDALKRRIRTRRMDEGAHGIFDMEDAAGRPLTSITAAQRSLQGCDTTFTTDANCEDGSVCTISACASEKTKCRAKKMACLGKNVEGLSFPFMSDLPSLVNLISGGDPIVSRMNGLR
jgi:hypothetical protein